MDILRLRYFRAVAQTENISQAAEKLLISQPALSKAISLLEDEVGVALFQRSGRRIALNEYGHAFLKYAELAIDAVDRGVSQRSARLRTLRPRPSACRRTSPANST